MILSIDTPNILVNTLAITKTIIANNNVGLYELITIPPNNIYGNSSIDLQKNIDIINVIVILAKLLIKSPKPTTYISIDGLLVIRSNDFLAALKNPSPVIFIYT